MDDGSRPGSLTATQIPKALWPASRRELFSWLAVIGLVLVSIGTPLLGMKSFLGGDVVFGRPPWNQAWSNAETRIPVGDTIDNLGPARYQAANRVKDGDVPAWDPLPAGGTELGAVPIFSVTSPFNLPYLIFGFKVAPAFTKLLELLAVVVGSVLFLRRLGASTTAGLFTGIAFAFSGFQVVWTNWPHTQTVALAPLIFWAAERAFQERRITDIVPLALSLAAMLAAGFPAVASHVIYGVIFYLVMRSIFALVSKQLTPRAVFRAATIIAGSFILGIGLMGAQLGPFMDQVSERDLSYRATYGLTPLPGKSLVTAAIPHAYGSPNQGRFYGPINPMESIAFVGTSTLLLAGLGFLLWRKGRFPSGAVAAFGAMSALITVALFFGSFPLTLINELPTISSSPFGRLRGFWGFVIAVAGGLGLQSLLDSTNIESDSTFAQLRAKWAVPAYGIAAFGLSILVGLRLASTGEAEGEGQYVKLGVVVALVALAAMIAIWLGRGRLKENAGSLALAVIGLEVLFFVIPFWPRIDFERVVPETPTHAYLQENVGAGRVVMDGHMLFTGTTGYFGLRTATGHIFHDDSWREMLLVADPKAFDSGRTISYVDLKPPGHVQSPALDRLRASHAVITVSAPVFGEYIPDYWEQNTSIVATENPVRNVMPSQPIRGVMVFTSEEAKFSHEEEQGIRIRVTAQDQVIESTRRLFGLVPATGVQIPIAGEDLPTTGEMTIEVSTFSYDKPLGFIENSEGEVGVGIILPVDDGLRLAYANGAAVYERLDALPRFHWASESVVIADPATRLAALSQPIDPNVVVLSESSSPTHTASAAAGSVVAVDETDPDVLKVDVLAEGSGWLVVGDALQGGWSATINGEPAQLVDADHAVVAVEVPSGRHQVELRFSPETGTEGLWATVLSALGLLVLGFSNRLRHLVPQRPELGQTGSGNS